MTTTTITRTKRGIFGKFVVLLNWLFHIFMILWAVGGTSGTSDLMTECGVDELCTAGTAIGTGIAFIFLAIVWALGSIIGGILLFSTRGKMISVTETNN